MVLIECVYLAVLTRGIVSFYLDIFPPKIITVEPIKYPDDINDDDDFLIINK